MFSFPFLKSFFIEQTVELSKQFPFTDPQNKYKLFIMPGQ